MIRSLGGAILLLGGLGALTVATLGTPATDRPQWTLLLTGAASFVVGARLAGR